MLPFEHRYIAFANCGRIEVRGRVVLVREGEPVWEVKLFQPGTEVGVPVSSLAGSEYAKVLSDCERAWLSTMPAPAWAGRAVEA
jgi:hypothetical protein